VELGRSACTTIGVEMVLWSQRILRYHPSGLYENCRHCYLHGSSAGVGHEKCVVESQESMLEMCAWMSASHTHTWTQLLTPARRGRKDGRKEGSGVSAPDGLATVVVFSVPLRIFLYLSWVDSVMCNSQGTLD